MRHRDFCYWLQGLFELGEPAMLSVKQVDCIKKHIALTEVCPQTVKINETTIAGLTSAQSMAAFVRTLKTIISDSKDGMLDGPELRIVKKLLNAEFVHIDADTPGDQDLMDQVHHGRPPRPPGTRC